MPILDIQLRSAVQNTLQVVFIVLLAVGYNFGLLELQF